MCVFSAALTPVLMCGSSNRSFPYSEPGETSSRKGSREGYTLFFFFSVKDEDVHCSLARVQFSLPVFPTKLDLLPLSHPPEFYIITTRELGP